MERYIKEMCCGCLSSDRRMRSVSDYWKTRSYFQMFTKIPIQDAMICVCWECESKISKFVDFQNQIRSCYAILQGYIRGSNKPQCISNLSICLQKPADTLIEESQITYTNGNLNVSMKNQDSDTDIKDVRIKEEVDVYSDDNKSVLEEQNEPVKKKVRTKKVKKKESRSKKKKDLFEEITLTSEQIEDERATMAQKEDYVNAMFRCVKCIISFPNKDDLNDHIFKKHELHASKHTCSICSRSFPRASVLMYHWRQHHRRLRCRECNYTCSGARDVTLHRQNNHCRSKSYEVPLKIYKKETEKPTELNGNKTEESFSCEYCNKTFKWKTSLRKHIETHIIEAGQKRKPYCEPCRLFFTTTSNLQKHVKTSSKHQIQLKLRKIKTDQQNVTDVEVIKCNINNKMKQYPCSQCDKKFQWKGNLFRHLQSHAARANGDLVCTPCNRTFSSIATYNQHMKISKKHVTENEFKYMCSDCGKRFSTKPKLKDHIDWDHLKNYTHTCSDCEKVFKSHTSLYLHRQVVHKKMNAEHLCDHCGKSFPNQTKLRTHITALHTRSTPYKCGSCSAKFSWHSCLSRHMRRVHRNAQPNAQ